MHAKFEEDYLLVKLTEFDIADLYMAGARDLRAALPNGVKINVVNHKNDVKKR